MDSKWFNQATASNGGFNDNNIAGNMVDLNLKLGLENHDDKNHQVNLSDLFNKPVPVMTPSPVTNFNFNGSNTGDKDIIDLNANPVDSEHFGTICNDDIIDLNANPMDNEFPSNGAKVNLAKQEGNQPHGIDLNNNVMNNSDDQNTSSMLGVGGHFNTNLLPPATLKNYTLLNFSSKVADEIGSSKSPRRYSRRRRPEVCYHDPENECHNPDCQTNNTPMWRRGPDGPKTLCNACGIRYRKEEDRRRAREASNRQNGN